MTDDKLASCCNKAIIIWNFNTGLALKIFEIMSYGLFVMKQIEEKKIIFIDRDEKMVKLLNLETDTISIIIDEIDCFDFEFLN